jgi:sulfur carrier protein ThiS
LFLDLFFADVQLLNEQFLLLWMDIFIERGDRKIRQEYNGTVDGLLRLLGINHEEVLVVKGDTLLTEDSALEDGDSIRILSVVSGG